MLKWVLKAGIFFTLFAFALNNQHDASLHLFFGQQWRSPMVLIVLAAFATGLVVGVLGMAPGRWKRNGAATGNPPPPRRIGRAAEPCAIRACAWTLTSHGCC